MNPKSRDVIRAVCLFAVLAAATCDHFLFRARLKEVVHTEGVYLGTFSVVGASHEESMSLCYHKVRVCLSGDSGSNVGTSCSDPAEVTIGDSTMQLLQQGANTIPVWSKDITHMGGVKVRYYVSSPDALVAQMHECSEFGQAVLSITRGANRLASYIPRF